MYLFQNLVLQRQSQAFLNRFWCPEITKMKQLPIGISGDLPILVLFKPCSRGSFLSIDIQLKTLARFKGFSDTWKP